MKIHLPTSLGAGVLLALFFMSNGALNPLNAATRTWTGGGSDGFWSTPANWGGTAPVAGDSLVFGGNVRVNTTNDFPAGTAFQVITFDNPSGPFTLSGNGIVVQNDIVNDMPLVPQTINMALSLQAGSITVSVVADGHLILAGVISGSAGAGISKTSDGQLTLSGVNTFTGPVSISGGTVNVASDANLGAAPAAPTPAQIVIDGGTLRTTSSFTLHSNRGIALGSGTGGNGTFEVPAGRILTYGGIIANNGGIGGLIKLGFGEVTLSGASTYTGPTAISNGTVTLDFTRVTSPLNNIIQPGSPLTLGGATAGMGTTNFAALTMNGKDGAANSQTFNGTTIELGQAQIRANSGAGGSANLALGALTRNFGGVVNIIPPQLTGGSGNITTSTGTEHGIIGGWAMVSDGTISLQGGTSGTPIPPAVATNFATVASGNIISYTNYTVYSNAVGDVANVMSAGNNVLIGSDVTGNLQVAPDGAGTTHNVNTLTFNRGLNWNLNIGAGNTLRLGRTGALFSQLRASSPTWGITSLPNATPNAQGHQNVGRLTAGGADDTPGEIIVHLSQAGSGSANNMVIDAQVTDNGLGAVRVVKAGPGFMKLRGHNTYSGGTYLLQGRLQLSGSEVGTSNPDGLGTGPLFIFPGGYLFFAGTGSPITNDMYIAGDAARQEQGIGAIRTSGGWLVQGTVTLIGDATIGGNGNVSGGIAGKITGPFALSLCSGGTVNGTIAISNPANDWSGTTTIQARNNTGANTFVSGASEVIPHGVGKGNVVMLGYSTGTITWNLNGFNETINGLSTSGVGASCTIQNTVATTSVLTIGENDQSGTFAGVIRDSGGAVALTKTGGGKLVLTAAQSYSGVTTIAGGTLALSGAGSIATSQQILINSGALDVSELAGGFTYSFPIEINNGALSLRNTIAPGINSLTLSDARIQVAGLGTAQAVIETGSLTTGGGSNVIDITSVGAVTAYPAQFTIIKYPIGGSIGGAGFNFLLGNVPTASTTGYVTNNEANNSVDVVLLDGPKPLTWRGDNGTAWDIGLTINWLAFNNTPSAYLDVDLVRFDDMAVNNVVNLTTTVQPSTVVVENGSVNFTFTGSGKLAGPTGLTKQGTGTLIIDNSGVNDFFGPVLISGGTVQVGNSSANGNLGAGSVANNAALVFARSDAFTVPNSISGSGTLTQDSSGILILSGNNSYTGSNVVRQGTLKPGSLSALGTADAGTVVENGATLDVNGQNLGAESVTVSGSGVGGAGAIVNSGGSQLNALRSVTLAGDTVFGGADRWDIRAVGGVGALNTGGNARRITKVGSNQVSLVGITVDAMLGAIDIQEGTFNVETTTTGVGDSLEPITVHANATFGLFNLTGNTVNKAITLRNGATLFGQSGRNTIDGAITTEGNARINVATAGTDPGLVINGSIDGPGGFTKIGSSPLILNGSHFYAGATVVSNGTLFVDGDIFASSGVTVFGGTLGGVGGVSAPVTITSSGVLSPGNAVTPIESLNISGNLTLAGTSVMDLNKTGLTTASDSFDNVSTLTLGGTLQLNITGDPLSAGDVFFLYSFASASGAFTQITPSTPGAGLLWDASQLAADGTLRVVSAPRPEVSDVSQSGGNLVLNGTGGTAGEEYYVLCSSDASLPLSQWTRFSTNMFDANGNFNVTIPVDLNSPQRFYVLELAP